MPPPTRSGPDRGSLHVDLSGIGSARVQEEIRETLARLTGPSVRERVGAWEPPSWVHHPGPGASGNPVLLMADFNRIAEQVAPASLSAWRSAARRRPMRVVGLVNPERDASQLVNVPRVIHAVHGRLSLAPEPRYSMFGVRRPGSTMNVEDFIFLLTPEALLEVRYLGTPQRLLLRFGDDLTAVIHPGALGLGSQLSRLLLDSATPSADGRSLHITEVSLIGGPTREHQGVVLDAGRLRRIAEGAGAEELDSRSVTPVEVSPAEDPRPFGVRLRTARTAAGLTQRELGSRTGLNQSVISNLERGVHDPRLATIERLAEGLEISSTELLAISDEGEAPTVGGAVERTRADPDAPPPPGMENAPERRVARTPRGSLGPTESQRSREAHQPDRSHQPDEARQPAEARRTDTTRPATVRPREASPSSGTGGGGGEGGGDGNGGGGGGGGGGDPGQSTRVTRRPLEPEFSELELPPPLRERPPRR